MGKDVFFPALTMASVSRQKNLVWVSPGKPATVVVLVAGGRVEQRVFAARTIDDALTELRDFLDVMRLKGPTVAMDIYIETNLGAAPIWVEEMKRTTLFGDTVTGVRLGRAGPDTFTLTFSMANGDKKVLSVVAETIDNDRMLAELVATFHDSGCPDRHSILAIPKKKIL